MVSLYFFVGLVVALTILYRLVVGGANFDRDPGYAILVFAAFLFWPLVGPGYVVYAVARRKRAAAAPQSNGRSR